MRVRELMLHDITYHQCDYTESLYRSVKRIGFSLPVKVKYQGNDIICVDGHKRLSVLHDLLEEDPTYHRGAKVPVVFIDNGDIRSNDASRGRNIH